MIHHKLMLKMGLIAVLLSTSGLTGPVAHAATPVVHNFVTTAQSDSNQAYAKFRHKVGLKALKVNAKATQVAELRAQQEVNSYARFDQISHVTKSGQSKAALLAKKTGWFKTVDAAKVHLSENIAVYQVSGDQVQLDTPRTVGTQLLQQFINEGPGAFNAGHGHYDNLVDAHNQQFGSGIAVKYVGKTYYYALVQEFVH